MQPENADKKIIRNIFFFILIFLISSNLFSQSKFGLTGSFNFSQIIGKQLSNKKLPLYLFGTGIFGEFKYGEDATIQVEIKYDLKGGILKDSIPFFINGFYEITERLEYITIPVIYKYKFEKKNSEFFLCYGAAVGYLMRNYRDYYGESDGVFVNIEYLFPYKNKEYTIDVIAGLGFRVNLMIVDLRYSVGFTSLYGKKDIPLARNSVISANLSYIFYKTRKKSYSNRRW